MAVGFGSSSLINGSEAMLGCEFLKYVRSKIERSNFTMSCVKKRHQNSFVRSWIDFFDSKMALQIVAVISLQMNGQD